LSKTSVNALMVLGIVALAAAAAVGLAVERTYTRLTVGTLMIAVAVAAATDAVKPLREAYWARYGKPRNAERNLRASRLMAMGYGGVGVGYIVDALRSI